MSDIQPPPAKLPANLPKWQEAVEDHGLVGKTVHTAELASASKMTYEQFLLLRILWEIHLGMEKFHLPPILGPYLIQAKKLLAASQDWMNYYESIAAGQALKKGVFAIAREYQIKAANTEENMRPDSFDTPVAKRTRSYTGRNLADAFRKVKIDSTPSKAPAPKPENPKAEEDKEGDSVLVEDSDSSEESSIVIPVTPAALVPEELHQLMFPPTKDEQIVNTALVVFLNTLALPFDTIVHCDWSLHRKAFVAQFEAAQYEARTDGYLGDSKENPWALIEVKPVARLQAHQSRIQIQESAQMCGWMKQDLDASLDKLRCHISQNRHEIFITIAEYDSGYISYLRTKPASDEAPSFLTMHQYGPWNTKDASHMKSLGPILLALTLYTEAQIAKAKTQSAV